MRIVLHVFLWYSDKLMVKTLRIRKDAWFLNSIVDLIIVFEFFWCVYIFALLHIYISNTLLILYSLIGQLLNQSLIFELFFLIKEYLPLKTLGWITRAIYFGKSWIEVCLWYMNLEKECWLLSHRRTCDNAWLFVFSIMRK